MTKYKIIANPNAGHGKGARAIPEMGNTASCLNN